MHRWGQVAVLDVVKQVEGADKTLDGDRDAAGTEQVYLWGNSLCYQQSKQRPHADDGGGRSVFAGGRGLRKQFALCLEGL